MISPKNIQRILNLQKMVEILGFFTRGMMVKEFDETVFNMKVGDVSPLVKTQFGFHIINLTEIKGEEVTFDSVKAQIKGEILYAKAQQIYAEGAEEFANLIYEKSDSLATCS